jgi:hypothetical protein
MLGTHYLTLMARTENQFYELSKSLAALPFEDSADSCVEFDPDNSDPVNYSLFLDIEIKPGASPQTLERIVTYFLSEARKCDRPPDCEVSYELVRIVPDVKIISEGYIKNYFADNKEETDAN